MMRRGKKTPGDDPPESTGGVWSDKDNVALQKMLTPLGERTKVAPFAMFGGEARGLLCTSKGEVYDRVLNFLTTLNVMAGLVLGAIAGLVQSPLDVKGLPEDKRLFGDIYNVLAYFAVTSQVCVVMFSTYMLFLLQAHGHTPEIVYRSLTYSGTLVGAMMLSVYIPLLMWLFMMVLTAHIYFDVWPAWICTALVAVLYSVFHLLFAYSMLRAYPRGMWNWVALTIPWGYCDKRARSDCERFGHLNQATTATGVLAGKDADLDGIVDASRTKATPEELELMEMIDAALPQLGDGAGRERRAMLLRALLAEGLTRELLGRVAKAEGGFKVLIDLLDLDQEERGVELTRGERVALALVAKEYSRDSTWGGRVVRATKGRDIV